MSEGGDRGDLGDRGDRGVAAFDDAHQSFFPA